MKKLIGSEITDEQFRQVNSRLDVHKQVIQQLISHANETYLAHCGVDDLTEMLEESQNPFEVSDEKASNLFNE